jgi:hypothetical protein
MAATSQMSQFLFSKGFFNGKASYQIEEKNDKAVITYRISTGKRYQISNLDYSIQDSVLASFFYADTNESLLYEGMPYDAYLLDDERDRIVKNLRTRGYYKFDKKYIRFLVDSSGHQQQLSTTLELLNRKVYNPENPDSVRLLPHQQYQINNIVIEPEYTLLRKNLRNADTLLFNYKKRLRDTITYPLLFVYDRPMRVKPRTYARQMKILPGDLYNYDNVRKTYNRLSGLAVTRFVNIDFYEGNQNIRATDFASLDARIRIQRSPIHSVAIETEGTNSAGRPGLAANLVYNNKNVFRGGELLNVSLSGSLEAQSAAASSVSDKFLFFNTIEGGVDASMVVPKFLLPVKPEFFSRDYYPNTNIRTGYNYQSRFDYTRYITKFSFGYSWQQSDFKRHLLIPMDINAVKIFKRSDFADRLASLDKKYQEQYTDHLISSIKYSYTLNRQEVGKPKDFSYLRINVESSGALLNELNRMGVLGEKGDTYGTILKIRYAQYFRTDAELRLYHYLNTENIVVFRGFAGIGLPYGNSDALPFEKAFYGGGANGMRGWKVRTLGPGGYAGTDSTGFDKIGDMQLEMNLEYRFPVYDFFKGALFTDLGNIWLLKPSPEDYPKGHFSGDTFIDQLGIDAGIGMRLDFQFFILRVDAAIQIRKPQQPINERWHLPSQWEFRDLVWNFGIGFPF